MLASDRIGEMFRLLGISSPYSISMDLKHFGHDLFLQGRTGFLTTNRLPVGPDYVLGPGDEVKIRVELGLGDERATAWGCDLTEDYIRINADYTT